MSQKSWVCRCCGEELGIIEHGALHVGTTVPTRLGKDGNAWMTCLRCSTGQCGRQDSERCKGGRAWTPASPQSALSLVH